MKRIGLTSIVLVGAVLAPTTGSAEISCSREGVQRAVDLYVAAQTKGDTSGMPLATGLGYTNRRFIVDETIGSVAVFCTFGAGGPNGGSGAPDTHLFRVENGKLRYVHTLTHLVAGEFPEPGRRGPGGWGWRRGGTEHAAIVRTRHPYRFPHQGGALG